MPKIESSIDVDVPVRVAYDQWTQFEEFPRFMDAVESVTQLDDTHVHWVASIAGVRKEWDAEITQQEPDQRVAWTSTSGAKNAGAVDFHRLGDHATRVTLTMDVEPDGVLETVGNAVGVAIACGGGEVGTCPSPQPANSPAPATPSPVRSSARRVIAGGWGVVWSGRLSMFIHAPSILRYRMYVTRDGSSGYHPPIGTVLATLAGMRPVWKCHSGLQQRAHRVRCRDGRE